MNPDDDWDSLADNLGLGDTHPPETPPQPAPQAEEAPRGRGRRKSSDDAPKRRRRAPKAETTEGEPMPADDFAGGIVFDAEATVTEPGEQTEELDADGQPRKRRRRRSRRKKTDTESATPAAVGAVEGEAEDGDTEPADISSIEAYASLNMPSWQELIDGLYKP